MSVRIGVVGTGGIAQFHLRAFAAMKTSVPLISELSAEKAQPWCERLRARYCPDWREMVTDNAIDAVAIFTPTSLHYPIAKAAMEAGKHVICEKTLTNDPRRSLELGRLAEASGLCFYTSYMKRYFPAVRQAKELMPRLGHLTSVYCRTWQPVGCDVHTGPVGSFAPNASGSSFIKRLTGGGVLICGGSHLMDLLLYLVGKPRRVTARSFTRPEADVDLMHHAMFDLDGGGVAHFEGNWHGLHRIGFERRGWDEGFEISGVNGRLVLQTPVWNQPEHNAARLAYYDNATGQWTDYCYDIVDPFAEAEKHFVAQMAEGEQGPQDRYTGYRADVLLEGCRLAAELDHTINLDFEA